MALNDLYIVIDRQKYQNQQVLNLYAYKCTISAGAGAVPLATAFLGEIIANCHPLQSSALTHVGLLVENLMDPTDFYDTTWGAPIAGDVGGDALSPFVAYTFILNRPSRLIRNGLKRIAGVPEAASTDGVNLVAGYVTLATAFAEALTDPLSDGAGTTWDPCILHRVRPGHPVPTGDVFTSAAFSHFGTQNSRKIGRGR